jgi:glycosyltransferase involved in cell wall biosynthesis
MTAIPESDPSRRLRIVIVSAFYSEGMGYSENCLSRALAKKGHDVHLVTSTFNVYGNEAELYDKTYAGFLGPRQAEPGTRVVDGYTVHRLDSDLLGGYVNIKGLGRQVAMLDPDIVHALEIGSLQAMVLAARKPMHRYKLFAETHQTLSVMRPYMLDPKGDPLKRLQYRMTRTLPISLASLAVERCYAVTPDCGEVAMKYYGVPASKITYLSLSADIETFHPPADDAERAAREALRRELGYAPEDILCVYTGRLTRAKNPLVLADAIDALADIDPRYKGLFIGEGEQKAEIAKRRNCRLAPFMTHSKLAAHYRAADIGVWPREESLSMIDAASSGVPLVVSNRIGEPARAEGNGRMYEENDIASLVEVLRGLADPAERKRLGEHGRRKMEQGFSWGKFADAVEHDFMAALEGGRQTKGTMQ